MRSTPLENGNYTVSYKIIGADSHVIEGNYTFSVDRPEQEQAQEENPEDKKDDNAEQALPDTEKKISRKIQAILHRLRLDS